MRKVIVPLQALFALIDFVPVRDDQTRVQIDFFALRKRKPLAKNTSPSATLV